jgi:hypothetical protein
MLDHQFHQDVIAVGPLIPPRATREGHDLCAGGVVAVRAAIDMEAATIERHKLRGKAQTLGRRGRTQTLECGDTIHIERISRPAERIIMERWSVDQHGSQKSRGRFVLEKPRHQRELLVHKAEAVENHGFNSIARGHDGRFWMVSGGTVNDLTKAKFIAHPCDQAPMVEDLTPLGVWHGSLLSRGASIDP